MDVERHVLHRSHDAVAGCELDTNVAHRQHRICIILFVRRCDWFAQRSSRLAFSESAMRLRPSVNSSNVIIGPNT